MIKYRLQCAAGHAFEGWFRSSDACDQQMTAGKVACPSCGDSHVSKAPMAPSVAKGGRSTDGRRAPAPQRAEASDAAASPGRQAGRRQIPVETLRVLRELRQTVENQAEYVGDRFAEEARRIHYKESTARGIYGEATLDDAQELAEEGIGFLPLPRLPEDSN